MVDIHSHILPGIDDGASNINETFAMIQEACDAGFTDIFSTSHYIENEYEFSKIEREHIINAIMKKVEEKGINIKIHVGAEAYISNNLPQLIKDKKVATLGNSRYVLFELPLNAKVMYTESIIDELIRMNLIPVIAHPERYEMVKKEPNIVLEWIARGALMQCNYGGIIGIYGNEAQNTLVKLLKADAVHFLGTDCHRSNSIYTKMEEIEKSFIKEIGQDKFNILSIENPKSVINNEKIQIQKPNMIKNSFFS